MKTDEQKDQAMTNPPDEPSFGHPGDWPEDFTHENGNYENRCLECSMVFTGHKRRVTCKTCANPPDGQSGEAKPCAKCEGKGWIFKGHGEDEQCDCIFADPPAPTPSPSVGESGTLIAPSSIQTAWKESELVEQITKELEPKHKRDREFIATQADQLAQARAQLAQVTAALLSVACVSVEQLKGRYLNLMERSNRRDLPHGFNSWEDFYNHIQDIAKERDALRSQVEALKAQLQAARAKTKEDALGDLSDLKKCYEENTREEVRKALAEVTQRYAHLAFDKEVAESRAVELKAENARLTTALAAAEKQLENMVCAGGESVCGGTCSKCQRDKQRNEQYEKDRRAGIRRCGDCDAPIGICECN